MEGSKISVIVPVYKVEPYLRKCLDSVVNQTYQNLEIILVDDGSPDRCGAICEEYAVRDKRIRVIHKENGGVSSARNAGLSAVTGEWIGWVDSDDWIEADMYECLLKKAEEQEADIAVCGMAEHCPAGTFQRGWKEEQTLDNRQALKMLLENGTMHNSLCDKLWRKELFQGLWFPEGQVYEDMDMVGRLFERAGRVLCVPGVKYHYIQREDGIMGDRSLKKRLEHYETARRRLEEMGRRWPEFVSMLEGQCVASAVPVWCGYYSNPREERKRYRSQIEKIAAFGKENYRKALEYISLGRIGRMVVRLIPHTQWWSFALAGALSWAYQVKRGRGL